MTKNQKMLLGVGAVAVVGYLVYKQMNKSKGFASMAPQPVFANAGGPSLSSMMMSTQKLRTKPCPKAYLDGVAQTIIYNGVPTVVYECAAGGGGIFTTAAPTAQSTIQHPKMDK